MHQTSSPASCGIATAASDEAGTSAAVAEIAAALGPGPFQHIIVMYSPAHHAKLVGELFRNAFPSTEVSGCSTSGEITPHGMMQGGIVAVAFPRKGFRVAAEVIADVDRSGVEQANELARRMKLRFAGAQSMRDRVFALLLVDGLSNSEENLIAAVHWAMDDVQLIGGSAGDDLAFRERRIERIAGQCLDQMGERGKRSVERVGADARIHIFAIAGQRDLQRGEIVGYRRDR